MGLNSLYLTELKGFLLVRPDFSAAQGKGGGTPHQFMAVSKSLDQGIHRPWIPGSGSCDGAFGMQDGRIVKIGDVPVVSQI